ncbi:MAG: polysaccharide biosynthesis tyrosine autokinase, partial [Nitrospirae bacterium]|nr:polysaccharide biosynthesis tyrosine autokinase [Nitrospirota bacterium]
KLDLVTEEDVTWALASQYSYPYIRGEDTTIAREVVAVHQPFSLHVELFRSIRSGIMPSGAGSVTKTIAVISPNEMEGKTFVASNLAAVFAQLGSKTILIDINFRRPRVHDIFYVKNNCGISSLIIKRATLDQAVKSTAISSLHILPAGPTPPNPVELLGWQDTRELINYMKQVYDVIIIDTPAFLKTADASVMSTISDGVVMVALKGFTTRKSFGMVKKRLDNAGVRIIGSLINEMNGSRRKK